MALYLHNPASDAHLQDLRDRLASEPVGDPAAWSHASQEPDRIERLVEVVRSMDRGVISPHEAQETFTRHGVPSFSRWLDDMLDEGVYLDGPVSKAA